MSQNFNVMYTLTFHVKPRHVVWESGITVYAISEIEVFQSGWRNDDKIHCHGTKQSLRIHKAHPAVKTVKAKVLLREIQAD